MQLKPYPKYKDTSIQWVGKIPEGWEVERYKIRFKYVKGRIPENLEETNGEGHLPYLSMGYLRGNEEGILYANNPNSIRVSERDLLLLWDGSNAGEFVLGKNGYLSSTMVKLNFINLNSNFSFYLCKSFEALLRDLTIGMGIPHVNGDTLGNIRIPLPNSEDQTTIANFLDKKAAMIDKLIEKDKQLIALLKEKRTAIINHAVTKGLDPNAKMKDSGIEWIGEIPEGWKVHKIKYKTIINKKKLEDNTNPNYVMNYLDISNVDSSGNILDIEEQIFEDAPSRARRVTKPGDTIISTVRTYLKAIAYLANPPDNLIVSTGFAVLKPSNNVDSKYIFYATCSEIFIQNVIAYSKGVAYPAINPPELGQIPIIIPPLPDQIAIANFLDKATSRIDKTIQKIEQKIKLLEEYKKSLIHHTVTGKIDVRERQYDN